MIRGIRGATTVENNDKEEIIERAYEMMVDLISANQVEAEAVVSVLFSATVDLNQAFPAKSLRQIEGWTYVPVMCMREIEVPDALPKCIRVMVTVQTERNQDQVEHIYHYGAKKLRPDLQESKGELS
ncbi:chorismate mutase [Thalassobacillus cyri]|uniref:chorismate mutase n=1 Tax=Thalassobacillus cyri TaxID=571932 RepID=A0A1H4CN15_9BACI|nr:chorismate mutase [Thalassobacillus cyri]SEA61717.1 chorismate mutase [Thalassobacillus cyri]